MVGSWLIFIIYCVFMLWIGYYGYKKTKDSSDYFVAGRSLGLGVSIPLFAAGFFSAASVLGMSSDVFENGWSFVAIYPVGLAAGWILLALVAPRFSRVRKNWVTTPDMYADRYYSPKVMRGWMSFFVTLHMALLVIMGLTGAGAILGPFLNISYEASVILVGIIFVIYTGLGGMYSVAWTNVAQFIALAISVCGAAIFGIYRSGGIAAINARLAEIDPAMLTATIGGDLSPTYIVGTAFTLALGCPILAYYHRMFMSARSERVAVGMIGFSSILLSIVYAGVLYIGLSARVLLPYDMVSVDGAFGSLIDIMPTLFGSIALCGVIAALQSSVDSQLLSASSVIASDVYKKLGNKSDVSDRELMNVSRNSTFLIGTICVIVAYFRPASIIRLYVTIHTLSSSVLFAPLMLGLFWPRCTREAGVAGSIFGFIAALLWMIFGPESIPATLIVVPVCFILMIIISHLTPEPPEHVRETFFPES